MKFRKNEVRNLCRAEAMILRFFLAKGPRCIDTSVVYNSSIGSKLKRHRTTKYEKKNLIQNRTQTHIYVKKIRIESNMRFDFGLILNHPIPQTYVCIISYMIVQLSIQFFNLLHNHLAFYTIVQSLTRSFSFISIRLFTLLHNRFAFYMIFYCLIVWFDFTIGLMS